MFICRLGVAEDLFDHSDLIDLSIPLLAALLDWVWLLPE